MAVYVDDMEAPFGRLVMCHMVADTHVELMAMATTIGVAHRWLQSPGNHGEHFDICKSKRVRAVLAGAIEITWRQAAEICHRRRGPDGKAKYDDPRPNLTPPPARSGALPLFDEGAS